MPAVLGVDRVSKAFGERRVLSELSFAIDSGQVYGLVGPNGAGKTTLINIACSVVPPDAGTVTLNGRPVTADAHARVGVASQDVALYRDLTSEQNLEFFAALYKLNGARRARRVAACLGDVGLQDRAHTIISLLSGGMRRRLHIAVAMLHQPDLLILDEPTVGLDLESRHRIWNVVRTVAEDGGSVLVTTHQLEEAEALCHRIGRGRAGDHRCGGPRCRARSGKRVGAHAPVRARGARRVAPGATVAGPCGRTLRWYRASVRHAQARGARGSGGGNDAGG